MGLLGRLFGKKEDTKKTAKDLVCGMDVDIATAKWKSTHGAGTYYFCSPGCKGKFDKDPHHFLGDHAH